jgi:hypothetical protein
LSNHTWYAAAVAPAAQISISTSAFVAVALVTTAVMFTGAPATTLVGATDAVDVKLGLGGGADTAGVGVALAPPLGGAVAAPVGVGAPDGETVLAGAGAGCGDAVTASVAADCLASYSVFQPSEYALTLTL